MSPHCGDSSICLSIHLLNPSLSLMCPRLKRTTPLMRCTASMNMGNTYSTAIRLSIMPRPSVMYTSIKKSAHDRWLHRKMAVPLSYTGMLLILSTLTLKKRPRPSAQPKGSFRFRPAVSWKGLRNPKADRTGKLQNITKTV